jgi:hypothetical protein
LVETGLYDNACCIPWGQTFVATASNVAGMVVLIDDPNNPSGDQATLDGPANLVLYDASDLGSPVALGSTLVATMGESLSGQLTLLFSAPIPTTIGDSYFIGIESADEYGIGLRSITTSTYPDGAEAWIDNGSIVPFAGSGRDLSFQILADTTPPLARI